MRVSVATIRCNCVVTDRTDRHPAGSIHAHFTTYLSDRIQPSHNCKLWEDLTREYVPVDYTLMYEDSDNTKLVDAVACAGGKCDVQ